MSVCERRLLKLNLCTFWVNHRVPCQSSQGRSHKRCDNCHTPRLAFHMPISHASNAPWAAEARERINQPLGDLFSLIWSSKEFANRNQLPKEPKNLTQTLWVWDVAYARDSAEQHGWHGSSNCGWLQRHWTNIKGQQRSSCTPRNALNQAMIYLVHTHSWICLETIPENMVTGSGAWSGR